EDVLHPLGFQAFDEHVAGAPVTLSHRMQPSTATRTDRRGSGWGMRKLVPALLATLLLAAAPAANAATKLTITGAGFGHGIGMSQYGTYGYSLHLKTYDFILGHYFTGTALGALDSNPEVKVLLQGSRKSISFAGGLHAGDQQLRRALPYPAGRAAAGLVNRDASGKSVGTTTGTLRGDAPVDQALLLKGTSVL